MPPPPEPLRTCRCEKCLEENPEGKVVSAKVFRSHAKKRALHDVDLRWDPSSFSDSPLASSNSTPENGPFQPPEPSPGPSLPPSIIDARLELQDIRYNAFPNFSFTRPVALEFASRPKKPLPAEVYVYSGQFNQRPYDLADRPTNALFLQQERRLHQYAQRLNQLRELVPQADHNYELQLQSIEKQVITSLNTMFRWKIELYDKIGPSPPELPGQRPLVDTTRFLQIYEQGDPITAQFVWSGLLLVLVLHLLFNTSQAVCDIVLALLHDQVHNLEVLIGEDRAMQMVKSIPRSVKGVIAAFDFDPIVTRYMVCPDCYAATVWKPKDNPKQCPHKRTPSSPECNAKLIRSRHEGDDTKERPVKYYYHQSMPEWVGRWLCRPNVEETLQRRKAFFKSRKQELATETRLPNSQPMDTSSSTTDENPAVHDILDSKMVRDFVWPDGKAWFDCPDDEHRLLFGLSADGFNPHYNREAKQTVTSTGIYLFCLNLPLEERYKPENVYLVGVIPGPNKPSTAQINHYISLLVDNLSVLWQTGVRFTRTRLNRDGVVTYAAIMPIMCDALGARQVCGYSSVTSRFFCTYCALPVSEVENFDKASWPQRSLDLHRHWAERWRDAPTEGDQQECFKRHGLRYTPLLRLPYFNPITFTIVDTMHNFFLGLLQRHCRVVWGMDLDLDDSDGRLRKKAPTQPPPEKLRGARRALEFSDIKALSGCGVRELSYLCLELDLRRGGRKKDLIRELMLWRNRQGPFLPESWSVDDAEEDAGPCSRTYALPGQQSAVEAVPGLGVLSGLVLPAEVSAERIEAAESAFARGLKMEAYNKPVLEYMCQRRGLAVHPKATKGDLVNMLIDQRADMPPIPKKTKVEKTVVLGRAMLTAVAEDMRRIELPRWVDPAPIRAGQKKSGKLSADQWRSFCTIHLVVTLIRIWGREPEDSRWYQMLTNFLDLVTAVELGSAAVTSQQSIEAYETVMKRYLVALKRLYKEARIIPNHHLALHVADFLALWGPSPHTRGFGWERYNHYLQQIKTNKRFGEIEKTYMYTSSRAANLLSLLSLAGVRGTVSRMYAKVQRLLNLDARGTRARDTLAPRLSPQPPSGRQTILGDDIVEKLAALLNQEQHHGMSFIPAHLSSTRTNTNEAHLLHSSALLLNSWKNDGMTYRSCDRSRGDSNVLIRCDSSSGLGYRPARLEKIFHHRRATQASVEGDVFYLIRCLEPLSEGQVQNDWFRRFTGVGGSLWSSRYEEDSQVRVVRPSQVLCHFARTFIEETSETVLGEATYHVLPLDRLRAHVDNIGEPAEDTEFEQLDGVAGLDIAESDVDDGDMDIDMDMDVDMDT